MNKSNISVRASAVRASDIRKIFNRAQELENVINFGIGEPDFSTPVLIAESGKNAIDKGYTRYTVNAGYPEIREVIAEKLKKDNNISASPGNEILLTCGGMGGLFLAFQTLLDPGDEVLVPEPSWLNYTGQITLTGGKKVAVPADKGNDFAVTAELLEDYVTDRTKLLILNTPTNPTGKIIPSDELQRIAVLADRKNFLILCDEVYEKFVWDGFSHTSIASFPEAAERTVTVNSLSKTYAMTGWRVGYSCGPAEIISSMVKLQENIYACPSSISQVAAGTALKDGENSLRKMVNQFGRRRKVMLEGLSGIKGIKFIPTEGSFYVFMDVSATGFTSEEFALRLLEEEHVALIPGSAFGSSGNGFVRISFATNEENIREGLSRISNFLLKM